MIAIKPDAYYVSVLDIEPQDLLAKGYRAVLLDLDNTLQPRGAQCLSQEVVDWVHGLEDAGLRVALISNTSHDRAFNAAVLLGVPLISQAFKPFKRGYVKACAALGVACRDAVMIGDQSYTDIAGAHRVGMDAIMVIPQSSSDPFHTYLLRALDRRAVRDMRANGGRL